MKLIKTFDAGYINPNLIESYAVCKCRSSCDVVAYAPSYRGDCECYTLGKCAEEYNAYQRLKVLVEWLTDGEDGIFDIMHIWESDDE